MSDFKIKINLKFFFGLKMKKFSKIKGLQMIGILTKEFDGTRFHKSILIRTKTFLYYINICIVQGKEFLSLFFDQNDPIQLFIGSYFNYLTAKPR